ncbi:MAG: ankyrin repeat domain-containing protein [Wolbachia sp.]|uniref:ankyrin repeat domain-containing protein n=1 Tax=Wolbachia endosymbiont (group A) of Anoplius nigerrimus TaxID=2953979 RepID=UPI0022317C64|nr:ankyrin repeat domain-containing protein [Wolbachia endosymbiont (group A) of Anoplius nigerrimus]
MSYEYKQFSEIYQALKSVSAGSSLNQGDVIRAIKSQLLSDSDAYKEWEKGKFSLDHVFTTANEHTESKHTLLTVAFNRADSKVADLLIKVGANVNAVGEGGLTPLIIAIEKKFDNPTNKALVDLLIEKADVNAAGADGMTPISKAVERGDLETFKALMEKKAKVDVKPPHGESLLEWAEFHKQCVKNKEDMESIINTLKAPSEEKKQSSESTGKQTPEKNDTTFWSKHKGKIALGVTGLCVAGAVAAYMLAYPAVALALTVLAAVILMGAIAKVLEDPSVEKTFTQQQEV